MIQSKGKPSYRLIVDRAQALPRSHQIAFAAACGERALQGLFSPREDKALTQRLVNSLWAAAIERPGAIDRVRKDESAVNQIADELDRKGSPSWVLQLFTLLETACELALGNTDIDLVVGPAQDIAYASVLQEYLKQKGVTKEGFYSSQEFFATARTYPVVSHELDFQMCLLNDLERTNDLTNFRKAAKGCSDAFPVLWKIGY